MNGRQRQACCTNIHQTDDDLIGGLCASYQSGWWQGPRQLPGALSSLRSCQATSSGCGTVGLLVQILAGISIFSFHADTLVQFRIPTLLFVRSLCSQSPGRGRVRVLYANSNADYGPAGLLWRFLYECVFSLTWFEWVEWWIHGSLPCQRLFFHGDFSSYFPMAALSVQPLCPVHLDVAATADL